MYIYLPDKSRAFFTREWNNWPLMQPGVHSALLISCFDFILKASHSLAGSSSLSTKTGPRRLFRPFTFDPPSLFVFPGPSRALPSDGTSLYQVALCVFCLPLPLLRATRVSCPSLSSVSVFTGDFFRPFGLARSSAASLFLLSHSGFRSVGLWGRKNERTNERANGRTDERNWRGASLSFSLSSFSRSRLVAARSFVRLLARSVTRPPFVSLALRRFCIFIDCHLTSPTTGRPRSAAVSPPLSRSSFPSSLLHSAATATAASCATRSLCPSFLLSFRAITLSSLPLLPFLSRSFF